MRNRGLATAISAWEVLSNPANEIEIRKNSYDVRPCDTDGEVDSFAGGPLPCVEEISRGPVESSLRFGG